MSLSKEDGLSPIKSMLRDFRDSRFRRSEGDEVVSRETPPSLVVRVVHSLSPLNPHGSSAPMKKANLVVRAPCLESETTINQKTKNRI